MPVNWGGCNLNVKKCGFVSGSLAVKMLVGRVSRFETSLTPKKDRVNDKTLRKLKKQ